MKLLIKSVIFVPSFVIAIVGCASKSKDVQVVERDTQPYHQVEAELQKPLTTTSADIKVLIEKNHPDFKDLVFECNYAENYLSDRSCSTKKLRGNKSLAVKCVAAEDRSAPEAERGSCAKQICINAKAKDCLHEGNTAISL